MKHLSKRYIATLCATVAGMGLIAFVASKSAPQTINEAQQFVIGTWTGSQTDYGIVTWQRFDFHADGTYQSYLTDPKNSGWGAPLTVGTWRIGSDKYPDTGRHYFYVELQWDTRGTQYAIDGGQIYTARYPILENGSIQMITDGTPEARLQRGDHFPY